MSESTSTELLPTDIEQQFSGVDPRSVFSSSISTVDVKQMAGIYSQEVVEKLINGAAAFTVSAAVIAPQQDVDAAMSLPSLSDVIDSKIADMQQQAAAAQQQQAAISNSTPSLSTPESVGTSS